MPYQVSQDPGTSPPPSRMKTLLRGLSHLCPACGQGRIYTGYLTIMPHCTDCSSPLADYRSEDAPAYFTIFIVGHIVVPGTLLMEKFASPEVWVQQALWLPLTLILTLLLLPRVKGVLLALQWLLKMKTS